LLYVVAAAGAIAAESIPSLGVLAVASITPQVTVIVPVELAVLPLHEPLLNAAVGFTQWHHLLFAHKEDIPKA
jgi:hypothetical protein